MATAGRALAAGNRHNRIAIEHKEVTTDDHGGEVEAWALYAQEWAQISYGTGQERRNAAQERASVAATFRVPTNPFTRAINPAGYRIQFNQYLWDVVGSVPLGRDGVEITAVSSMEVIVFSPIAGISAVSSVAGALSQTHSLAAPILAQAAVTGALTIEAPLSGAVAAGSSMTGELTNFNPNLITNGTFDSGDNWTLTQSFGSELPTIGSGVLNSTADNEGNVQFATQVLVGGSVPAGSYNISGDTSNTAVIQLFGAADEFRGDGALTGLGATDTIVADGEVSKLRIQMDSSMTVDNVSMTPA